MGFNEIYEFMIKVSDIRMARIKIGAKIFLFKMVYPFRQIK